MICGVKGKLLKHFKINLDPCENGTTAVVDAGKFHAMKALSTRDSPSRSSSYGLQISPFLYKPEFIREPLKTFELRLKIKIGRSSFYVNATNDHGHKMKI